MNSASWQKVKSICKPKSIKVSGSVFSTEEKDLERTQAGSCYAFVGWRKSNVDVVFT
jgi:hypothetical protein